MSFWDTLKPAAKPPVVVAADLGAGGSPLTLSWDDGKVTPLAARALRQACPCAQCVDEWTHQRTFDPKSIPEGLRIDEVRPVGNYALGLRFSDAHSTGIFTWTLLRQLAEASAAAAAG